MSNDDGSGTSDGGQQEPENTSGTGTTGTGTGTANTGTQAADDFDADVWRSFAKEVGLTPAKIQERLGHARTWEQRARENKGAADQVPTLQQQLDAMKSVLAERDVRDVERNGKLALTQVRSGLAEAGIKVDDVKELLDEIEPTRLLKNGEPDDKSIERIVGALRKAAGRPTADPDQGKGAGSKAPADMNSLIRSAAGRGN